MHFLFLAAFLFAATPAPAAASPSPSPSASAVPSPSPKPTATPTAPFGMLKWRSIGPAASGGRVATVAGSATQPGLYYFGAAGGGVWKSENYGMTWSPVFDSQDVQAIGAVTIAPSDNKIVWVGTGEANPRNDVMTGDGIYKSIDSARTWTNMGLSGVHHIARIAVDPANADHVIVAGLGDLFKDSTAGGIYETEDGGKTWLHALSPGPSSGASDVALDPKDPNVAYAGVWQFRRLPWTFFSGGPDDALYKSIDGGKTWSKLAGNGLPAGLMGRIALAIAPSDSNRVYALIQSKAGFLYRSDDAGATWKMESTDTLVDQRPFYFSNIAVDPKDENHVYSVSEMASESKDGGKTFNEIASGVHVDYHAIWIAPNDPKRIILGEDGGVALSFDGGRNWGFARNAAIGQIYHVGLDSANPFAVCAGFQDNNGWCWPSNSRDRQGITNADVLPVIGGDGEWAVPDPANADNVWADLEDGVVHIYMRQSRVSYDVEPYPGGLNAFAYDKQKYRFNWDSPIAFAPWDPHTVWYGGNVIFQSTDEGRHWTPISPDLSLNIKSHQQPPGGPINFDVSGAEGSDNILDIEGALTHGEIWIGTDDGRVQLTRDGGKHWSDATPAGLAPYARVETIMPSPFADGTAFASFDRHYSGDNAPYVMKTTDFGKTWASIAAGLPDDQPARTVRQDPVNPNILYAGLERSLWVSFDGGRHWRSMQFNLPHTAVFDIRFQPQFDDMVIGTHGRSAWILDDLRPIQDLDKARAAGQYLFAPPSAYQYTYHSKAEGLYSDYAAPNPPSGAIVDFYQAKPEAKPPEIDILDASGHVVRHYRGTHKSPDSDKREPWVTNYAGVNRFVWGFQADPITPWYGAANKAEREPSGGLAVVPGRYTARLIFANGATMSRTFEVKTDPDSPWTQAQLEERHRFQASGFAELDEMNRALNSIDAQIARLKKLGTPNALSAAQAGAALENSLTANFKNDEDSILYPSRLREEIGSGSFGSGPPLQPDYDVAAVVKAQFDKAMVRVKAWLAEAHGVL